MATKKKVTKKKTAKKVEKSTSKKATKKTAVKKTAKVNPLAGLTAEQLLRKLKASTDAVEKRQIRAQLRKIGHTGGLRQKK